ncbi:MAG: DUF192 domain-containing protein [Methanosarcinales archaeon]|nr:DUF192 domain-containing protein [Methanosarcinales archaeon]
MVLIYSGKPIANEISYAKNIFSQMLGLMLHKSIPEDFALIFVLKRSGTVGVHMLFMLFPIDVIFLDADKKIIGTATLKPWTGHKRMKGVKYIIEMNQGTVERFNLVPGEQMTFKQTTF